MSLEKRSLMPDSLLLALSSCFFLILLMSYPFEPSSSLIEDFSRPPLNPL
jgi:hypothetical protein